MNRAFKYLKIVLVFPALLFQATLFSQPDLSLSLREKFSEYTSRFPWEDVFMQTDRSEYIAGEEVWISAWIIDRKTSGFSSMSSVLYVEILNHLNVPVAQKRIMVNAGKAGGDILLPDTLMSGRFTIRAYTGWMKNFMPANCFRKTINVYNTLQSGEKIKVPPRVPSREGTLSASSTSLRIQSLDMSENNLDIVLVKTAYSSGHCYLAVQSKGTLYFCEKVLIPENSKTVTISKERLGHGVNQVTLFDFNGRPVSELYCFVLKPDKTTLSAGGKEMAGKREKYDIQIDPAGILSGSDSLSVSISVTPKSEWYFNTTSADWMVLGSEFGLMPEDMGIQAFATADKNSLDLAARKLRSEWIDWERIISGEYPPITYEPEKGVHYISGQMISRETRKPLAGNFLFLSTPGKKAIFQYSRTGNDGIFRYPVPVSPFNYDLIIQPEQADISATIVMGSPFSELYKPQPVVQSMVEADVPSYILRWGANHQVVKIFGIQNSLPPADVKEMVVSGTRFYGKPDVELKLDDYIKLPVMQEIFFELLPGVPLRSRKEGYEIRMLDPVEQKPFLRPPVLFVDGVVINDAGIIAGLDPEYVEQIDVIKDRYIVGDYLFYGIINVITRRGDFSAVTLPEYSVRLRFRTSDPVAMFKAPDYSSGAGSKERIPDFRNTLFWKDELVTGENGTTVGFHTSDLAGEYEINITGFTKSGKPVSFKKYFTVQ